MLTFGSLFAGIGGFDLGFERAGMVCKWQVEIDPFCQKVLAKHWPDLRRHSDARTFPPSNPEEWQVDVICGGDPCQGNSNAGSVYKSATDDLGTEFLRVINAIRPRIIVRENPSITRPGAKWSGYAMQGGLRSIGYKACAAVRLRACCFGLGHKRERLFLLAALSDADRKRLERIDWQGVKAGGRSRNLLQREQETASKLFTHTQRT